MDISLANQKEEKPPADASTMFLRYARPSSEGADLCDSLGSDTESLLQEKAFQRQLHVTSNRNTSPSDAKLKPGMKSFEYEESIDSYSSDPQPAGIEKRGAAGRNKHLSRCSHIHSFIC